MSSVNFLEHFNFRFLLIQCNGAYCKWHGINVIFIAVILYIAGGKQLTLLQILQMYYFYKLSNYPCRAAVMIHIATFRNTFSNNPNVLFVNMIVCLYQKLRTRKVFYKCFTYLQGHNPIQQISLLTKFQYCSIQCNG